MLNSYGMFFFLYIIEYLLSCLLNVKLLQNVCTSITKGLLLCYSECQIVMNHLNEHFK
jgi:surface polysaccharide O-acyltransferase-like enzyme